jgi:hypothetical protein
MGGLASSARFALITSLLEEFATQASSQLPNLASLLPLLGKEWPTSSPYPFLGILLVVGASPNEFG